MAKPVCFRGEQSLDWPILVHTDMNFFKVHEDRLSREATAMS